MPDGSVLMANLFHFNQLPLTWCRTMATDIGMSLWHRIHYYKKIYEYLR